MDASLRHETVMLNEAVAALALNEGDVAIDCTVGGGGHTEAILQKVGPSGRVIGLDRDAHALERARQRLGAPAQLTLLQKPFSQLSQVVKDLDLRERVNGILADIGVSSFQIDDPGRGFSFRHDGPLDMRMSKDSPTSAADIIRSYDAEQLIQILQRYGEEPKAKLIARAIVHAREQAPIETTQQLRQIVLSAVRYRDKSKKDLATKTFQALRIAVNDELRELETLLESSFAVLQAGGHLGVISFHSLEDRIVKDTFTAWARSPTRSLPREIPIQGEAPARGRLVKPFPLVPSDAEVTRNPRARSAKLRVIKKLASSPANP